MTRIVGFVAGPSAGKSTLAGELFGWMKRQRFNCEYVSEFAKDLTWRKQQVSLDDQIYVLGEQHHRVYTLIGQVDWIITDSPLVQQLTYVEASFTKYHHNDEAWTEIKFAFNNLVQRLEYIHQTKLFFVERGDRKFIQAGRNQDEEQSREIDQSIKELLDNYRYTYTIVKSLEDVLLELNLQKE